MSMQLHDMFKTNTTSKSKNDRLKLLFLSTIFFLVIGGYTVIRTLKDSLFVNMIGAEYVGWAKLWSIIVLIPAILLFSKLVDVLRRHQLLYIYSLLYGVGCLTIAYFIGHPTIGLLNPETSQYRLFGWVVYFFLDGMNPFLVSLVWSLSHSITSPDEAKINYPIMVAASKFGGMLTAGFSCWFLSHATTTHNLIRDVMYHQFLFGISSLFILMIPLFLYFFINTIPGKFLHGYEAAHEKEKLSDMPRERSQRLLHPMRAMFSGLILLIKYPYVLGIFGIMFFGEIVNVFLNLERIGIAQKTAIGLSGQTFFLLQQDFWVHVIGFMITLIGTRTILALFGERRSLLLVPFIVGILLINYFLLQSAAALSFVFILCRAINYAFVVPLRESLYIPTTKEIKFKSKTWIEAFGVKIAKAIGGTYVTLVAQLSKISDTSGLLVGTGFFSLVMSLWFITAYLLGKRFDQAIAKNEVIGSDELKK